MALSNPVSRQQASEWKHTCHSAKQRIAALSGGLNGWPRHFTLRANKECWDAYRRRIYFTDKQKAEIWDRWQREETMKSIGRLFDRNSSLIYRLLARIGGIRPPERRRSRLALTLAEREKVSRILRAGLSFRFIARQHRRALSQAGRSARTAGKFGVSRAVPSFCHSLSPR